MGVVFQVNYLDVSEDRAGRDSDQSSYQQSDERDTESESDGTVEYGECCWSGRGLAINAY